MNTRNLAESWHRSHHWTAAVPGVDIVSREQAEAVRRSQPFSGLEDASPVPTPSEQD